MEQQRRRIDYMPLADVLRAPRNPKKHNTELIANSISRFGIVESPAIDERTGRLVAGHGRLDDWVARKAAGENPPDGIEADPASGDWMVPVQRGWSSRSDADAEAYLVISNSSSTLGGWDDENLAQLLADLRDQDPGLLDLTGFDGDFISAHWDGDSNPWDRAGDVGDGDLASDRPANPSLFDRFLIPPFDVLDARSGPWQARKKQWKTLGLESEIGRGENLTFADITSADIHYYDKKRVAEAKAGRELGHAEFQAQEYPEGTTGIESGTSIFDPVLCELSYRWFTSAGAVVLDPFAGGSVRGIVAGALDRSYIGNDLSAAQVEANRAQVARIVPDASVTYTVGDSEAWVGELGPDSVDMIMTCPPYYDLEEYSTDPADLSAMSYGEFDIKYASILAGAVRALRKDRFAVVVTGDARDSKGALHDLRGATIRAMEAAGCGLVSGGVLLTQIAAVALRTGRQFTSTRTLARCHQDVLVFVKGSRQAATAWCGDVDVTLPDALDAAGVDEAPAA